MNFCLKYMKYYNIHFAVRKSENPNISSITLASLEIRPILEEQ